jgi:hypothetical protein
MVDLDSYIFPIIEYDPTEKPRGIVTYDEWNTILNLLKQAVNYNSRSMQEIVSDLYTASELSSTEIGKDGSRLIGIDVIPGVVGENVNEALRNLKEQLDGVVIGNIPDNSIGSEKLMADLNFRGDTLTWNDISLVTADDIIDSFPEGDLWATLVGSTTVLPDGTVIKLGPDVYPVPTASLVYRSLKTKQDKISMGTADPDKNTPGNIYFQYIA